MPVVRRRTFDVRRSLKFRSSYMETAKNDLSFPCGSQWRKWDLHVHSPASANFKGDWPGFVIQLGNSDCAVIGINDYFSVAGYKELRGGWTIRRGREGNKAYREASESLRKRHCFRSSNAG